jgi:hypothetical protein
MLCQGQKQDHSFKMHKNFLLKIFSVRRRRDCQGILKEWSCFFYKNNSKAR